MTIFIKTLIQNMEIKPIENYDFDEDSKLCNVAIDEVMIKYVQCSDCTEEDGTQEMTLTARNNGIGRFVNLQTESWSIESGNELVEIVNDFMKRASLV